jgi:hypothetical protein
MPRVALRCRLQVRMALDELAGSVSPPPLSPYSSHYPYEPFRSLPTPRAPRAVVAAARQCADASCTARVVRAAGAVCAE